ncbi:hypothetical protein [Candidatus Phyllobacterium onerii]|uniref:hypothetical protein n=1 Tax=Candidatus Phyllobacterium onerii TaxID=3020828 RepID=UPI00232D54D3|nr:hypothetical protein [Phyllobacterium sp. IY22]
MDFPPVSAEKDDMLADMSSLMFTMLPPLDFANAPDDRNTNSFLEIAPFVETTISVGRAAASWSYEKREISVASALLMQQVIKKLMPAKAAISFDLIYTSLLLSGADHARFCSQSYRQNLLSCFSCITDCVHTYTRNVGLKSTKSAQETKK